MSKNTQGFTLIELMIVVSIISILSAIAVPNFIAYRNKTRIASGIATASSIRNALSGYASINQNNAFPTTSELVGWINLYQLCNIHGAPLEDTMYGQGYAFFLYHGVNIDGALDSCDNSAGHECADICIVFRINGVPQDQTGAQLELRSSGIARQTY